MAVQYPWHVGVEKTLSFTVGALDSGDVVYVDYFEPDSEVLVAGTVAATVTDRTTGACTLAFTPAEAGTYRFLPRVMTSAGDLKDQCRYKSRYIESPGEIAEVEE